MAEDSKILGEILTDRVSKMKETMTNNDIDDSIYKNILLNLRVISKIPNLMSQYRQQKFDESKETY